MGPMGVLRRLGVLAAEALIPGIGKGATKKEIALAVVEAMARKAAEKQAIAAAATDEGENGPEIDRIVNEFNVNGWPNLEPTKSSRINLSVAELEKLLMTVHGPKS